MRNIAKKEEEREKEGMRKEFLLREAF